MNCDSISRGKSDGARVFLLMDSFPSDYRTVALHPSFSAIPGSVTHPLTEEMSLPRPRQVMHTILVGVEELKKLSRFYGIVRIRKE